MMDAEDFFIFYMMTCENSFLNNRLFLIGHSVELYLKAIYIKQTGDIDGAMNNKHNVRRLFELCQAGNPPFMPNFSFKGNFEELHTIANKVYSGISFPAGLNASLAANLTTEETEKFKHFIEYQEFYLVSENLLNLKYFYSPWKGNAFWKKMQKSIAFVFPNPFWIDFVKEAKEYLGYDTGAIKRCIEGFGCNLSPNTRSWLSEIYK